MIRPGARRSVTRRFLAIILILFTLSTLASLAANWAFADAAAEDAYDRLLTSVAVQIVDSIERSDAGYRVNPPDSVFDTLRLAENDRFFYAVRGPRGELLTGYPTLPTAGARPTSNVAQADANFLDAPVRLVSQWRRVGQGSDAAWVVATVAQTKETRNATRLGLFVRHAPVTLAIIALGLLASVIAARIAVRPLAAIEQVLARRSPQDLTPIAETGPAETAALVTAINGLMRRSDLRLAKLHEFAALAAHQLRTPLTALSAQMDLLQHEAEPAGRQARIDRLRARLGELNRLIHQLLGHAMVTYRGETSERVPIDLVALSRAVVLDDDAGAAARGLELHLVSPDEPVVVHGDAVLLREAVANLFNNAVIHGARRHIQIEVRRDQRGAQIAVSDDGPGFPSSTWEDTARPFALKRQDDQGSGLGLSIVQEIARSHGGTLSFANGQDGMFVATISFEGTSD